MGAMQEIGQWQNQEFKVLPLQGQDRCVVEEWKMYSVQAYWGPERRDKPNRGVWNSPLEACSCLCQRVRHGIQTFGHTSRTWPQRRPLHGSRIDLLCWARH